MYIYVANYKHLVFLQHTKLLLRSYISYYSDNRLYPLRNYSFSGSYNYFSYHNNIKFILYTNDNTKD